MGGVSMCVFVEKLYELLLLLSLFIMISEDTTPELRVYYVSCLLGFFSCVLRQQKSPTRWGRMCVCVGFLAQIDGGGSNHRHRWRRIYPPSPKEEDSSTCNLIEWIVSLHVESLRWDTLCHFTFAVWRRLRVCVDGKWEGSDSHSYPHSHSYFYSRSHSYSHFLVSIFF